MNKELHIKRKGLSALDFGLGDLIRFNLFTRLSKVGWIAGIRIIFKPKRSPFKAEQTTEQKPILQSLSISQKIELGYRVWNALSTNPAVFDDPVPSMDDFKTVIDELYNANYNSYYNNNNGGPHRLRQVALNVCEYKFVEQFRLVMKYVDMVAMGRMEIYLRAGVDGVIRY